MNKVMTRTKRHPGTRPPGRRDTRHPGSAPPRGPGPGAPRGTPGGSPPSTPPGEGASPTAPVPPTAPLTRTTPPRSRPSTASPAAHSGPPAASPAPHSGPPTASSMPHSGPPASQAGAALLAVPIQSQAPRTGPAPQPRPTDLFADRLLAVLSGQRPVHCMLRHTAGRAYDELAWLAERGPLRARGTRPVVRDIGYYVARPGAIEAFARIGAGDQLRAMAFRLEQGPDLRWRCTAVELGGPRMPRAADD
ncbi:Rv3235 family protein [Streptomyces sp. NPDC048309]|uniref:Rv3235 family protein n=1 Tax=Streptomyces sp. NPDC048309 TaxID=3154618 RepID=UPI0033ED335F